jgi:hypothetical protein
MITPFVREVIRWRTHECAHFVYSLRDEYGSGGISRLRTSADVTIMNNQSAALADKSSLAVTNPGSSKWLNFSTKYNYHGLTYPGRQTSHWSVCEKSAWDALVSRGAKITLPGLEPGAGYFYRKYLFGDLGDAHPNPTGTNFDLSHENDWYSLEYPDGLPPSGAVSADFYPPGNETKSADLKFSLPSVEFGPPTRASLIIFDNSPATKPRYTIDGQQVTTRYNKAIMSNIILHIAEFYNKNDGGFNHLGVYAYDSTGVNDIAPIQEITDANISLFVKSVWENGCEARDSVGQGGAPINRAEVLEGITEKIAGGGSSLSRYMKDKDIVLGDVCLITGGLYGDDLFANLQTLREAGRKSFIPIHVETFGRVDDTSRDHKVAANTGGGFEHSLVPNEPLSMDVIDGCRFLKVTSRNMSIAPYVANKKIMDFDFRLEGTGAVNPASRFTQGRESSYASFPPLAFRLPYVESGESERDFARAPAAAKKYIRDATFKMNGDVKTLSILLMSANTTVSLDLKLTAPDGSPISNDKKINVSNSPRGGITSFQADVSQFSPISGDWKIELVNDTTVDCGVAAFVFGDAGAINEAYFNDFAVNAAPTGFFSMRQGGDSVIVTAAANQGGACFTGVTQELTVCEPDGGAYSILLRDDGMEEDLAANDGVYSGTIDVDAAGLYILKSRAANENGTAKILKGNMPAYPFEEYFEVRSETELMVIQRNPKTADAI